MAIELSAYRTNRWAITDGPIALKIDGEQASVTAGSSTAALPVVDGTVEVPLAKALELFPSIGVFVLSVTSGETAQEYRVERVKNRYTNREQIIAYGKESNDGFEDEARYSLEKFTAAIQAAEETIERGCRRRFCASRAEVTLYPGKISELPMTDCWGIECEDPEVRLVSACQAIGVTRAIQATVSYGLSPDALINEAATRLAASYLRPRAAAENARGTAIDGVYVSYDLATGDDGGWTGLPYVDSVIEARRSHRSIVG